MLQNPNIELLSPPELTILCGGLNDGGLKLLQLVQEHLGILGRITLIGESERNLELAVRFASLRIDEITDTPSGEQRGADVERTAGLCADYID